VAPGHPDKAIAAMCSLVGIKRFRLHDLRHAFASITISNGTSVKEISTLLGHSSPMLTLSTYARSMEGQGREAVSQLAQNLLRKHQESPSSC
jgi:integrase